MIKKWLGLISVAVLSFGISTAALAGTSLPDKANHKDVASTVQAIRDMYNLTNSGNYTQKNNQWLNQQMYSNNVVKTAVSNGNAILDQVMKANGYQQYSIEYYYHNYDSPRSIPINYDGPYFAFAVIDGNEYRYYFSDNSLIRRIGPDGTVSDNPQTNDFLNSIYQVGSMYMNDFSTCNYRNLNQETIYFGHNFYMLNGQLWIYARVLNENDQVEYQFLLIDTNTRLNSSIQSEETWQSGDNGYSWIMRHLSTDPVSGGYASGIECFQVNTTDSHVDYIEGIYATH